MAGDGVEIGTAYVSIIPEGSRIGPEVKKSFGVVDQEADRVGRTSGKRFGGVFKSTAGKVMAGAGGIFAAAQVKDFLGESIGIASDLNEAGTKLDAIFGKASARVQDFASGGAKALGQSRLDILDAAATFGVFGKAAGLQGPKLAKFSTRLTTLSTDLASFHNADPSEVVEALGAALRGEAEPMRRFGVMLNDASLKAEAMAMGILKPVKDESKITGYLAKVTIAQDTYNKAVREHGKDSIEALKAQAALGTAQSSLKKATEGTIPPLTAQQKTLAAQSLIFKQTKDAQGDFNKTSEGLANQQRILKARFEDLKGEIGEQFLPIAKDVVTFLNDRAMPAVEEFIDGFKGGKGAGGKARELFETIRDASKDAAGFVKDIGTQFDKLPEPVKKGLLLGAAGAYAAKKTGVLGAVGAAGKLRGSTPLTPMFVKVVGAGPGKPPLTTPPTTKPSAGGKTPPVVAPLSRTAVTGARALARYGVAGAAASAGGVRTYDVTKPNDLGLRKLPFTKDLADLAKDRTGIDNVVKAMGALDEELASLAMRKPGAGLREFKATAREAGVSTADLAKALPGAAGALKRAGIDAKDADRKVFGLKGTVKRAADELVFLGKQHPKVTIRTNAKEAKRDIESVEAALRDAKLERTARVRLAISQNGTGFGFQRASGGPAYAGQNYTVNEHLSGLREQFVPAVDGRILSRRDAMTALAGGPRAGVQISGVTVVAQDPNEFLRKMQDRARREAGGGVEIP